jgi:tetratricopeptide (TPR) repeat protein
VEQQSKEHQIDKFKLIYEFNNSSPLFTRIANSLIKQGSYTEALKILNDGLKKNPNYPTAHFILATALAYSGKENDAIEEARKGSEIIRSDSTFDFYLSKIREIINERNSLKDSRRPSLLKQTEKPSENFEDSLESLALKLTSAKIIYDPNDKELSSFEISEYQGSKIASETLAKIYAAQGDFKEAISVYHELAKKNPDRGDEFAQKILELQKIIDDESGIQFNGIDEKI